jgi:superfamily II DNA or RNA helicase
VSDPVADALRSCAFAHPLRTHQQLALDAATDGRNYLFLPPGAGKTVVGWEAARRLGQRILVLTPNTAVQDQWAQTWQRDFGPGPDAVCGADPLARESGHRPDLSVAGSAGPGNGDRSDRRHAVRGTDRAALLDLLHPNGRDLIDRAVELAPWTLVLDECHHLLQAWGALVRAVVEELGARGARLVGRRGPLAAHLYRRLGTARRPGPAAFRRLAGRTGRTGSLPGGGSVRRHHPAADRLALSPLRQSARCQR